MIHWTEKHRGEIEIFMHHRFTMEQQLAHDLLFEFDNNDKLIGPLREMAAAALEDLGKFPAKSVEDALRDEAAMGVMSRLKKPQAWDQSTINELKRRRFSAEQCTDIIRLYGAAVEKAGPKGAPAHFTAMAKEKQFARPEPGGGFDEPKGIFDGSAGAPFRIRKETSPTAVPEWQKSLTGGPGDKFEHPTKWKQEPTPTTPGVHKLTWGQGILLKQAAAGSTVLRMDRTFGLPIGADLSGTTADSIYFINKFGKLVGATDPIYQLLPMATLVFNFHHSLLEVALTLTLNKVIEYTVGFYRTLLPLSTQHPARQDLFDILLAYETRPDNKHILIYYEGQEIKGCYQFERSEAEDFRKVGTASFDYWNTFPNFQDHPRHAQILWLLTRKGLKTKVDQARSPEKVAEYSGQLSR